jgi:nucleotide-binding universal stress UspA family protein
MNTENYAAEIAKRTGSLLMLLNIYVIPTMTGEIPAAMPSWDWIEEDCQSLIKKAAKRLHRKFGTGLSIDYVYRTGFSVSEIIRQYVRDNKPDLVVMGMERSGFVDEKLIGSFTTDLISTSCSDVLVIHSHVRFNIPLNIVFACDIHKKTDKATLAVLNNFIDFFKVRVHVLNITGKPAQTAFSRQAEKELTGTISSEGTGLSFHSIENDDVMDGINTFASAVQADMIVLIHQHHSLFNMIFQSSKSKQLAFHTSLPLLVLHE